MRVSQTEGHCWAGSIRSVKGEPSTAASCEGHMGVSNAIALPKLRGAFPESRWTWYQAYLNDKD